ncbi:MAG: glycosylphosphatidylinositol anchor biosynthesis [Alyxoria varia]|nr:MAG: glycosylphosphatidylinositol anchor biosynthesis [Alyxoria varia]
MHNRGAIAILSYLRIQFKALNPEATIFGMIPNRSLLTMLHDLSNGQSTSSWQPQSLAAITPLTAAFLMPCHSTPWRSHLINRDVRAWALTCEPPLDLHAGTLEREQYLDEADMFYEDPASWLRKEMAPVPKNASIAVHESDRTIKASWRKAGSPCGEASLYSPTVLSAWQQSTGNEVARNANGQRLWPQYIIFFEQLEPVIREVLGGNESVLGKHQEDESKAMSESNDDAADSV